MRHRKTRNLLNRRTAWRTATIKSLARNLFVHESIKTTLNRAKAAQPIVEKLISWGKANTVEKKRLAFAVLGEHSLVSLVFSEVAPRFKNRSSGFTRILRMENRRGDDAQMVIFQLTEVKEKPKTEKGKKKAKSAEPTEEVIDVEAQEAPAKTSKPKKEVNHEEKDEKTENQVQHKADKAGKKFLGGIRGIFKKERDSL